MKKPKCISSSELAPEQSTTVSLLPNNRRGGAAAIIMSFSPTATEPLVGALVLVPSSTTSTNAAPQPHEPCGANAAREHDSERRTFRASFLVLVTAGLGTGVLSLPFAFSNAGLIWGILALFLAGFSTALSSSYLGSLTKEFKGVRAYGGLVEAVAAQWLAEREVVRRGAEHRAGYRAPWMANGVVVASEEPVLEEKCAASSRRRLWVMMRGFDLLLYVYMTIEVTVYMLFLTDFVVQLLPLLLPQTTIEQNEHPSQQTRAYVVLCLALLTWPLAMVPQLTRLKFLSEACLLAIFVVVFIILGKGLLRAGRPPPSGVASMDKAQPSPFQDLLFAPAPSFPTFLRSFAVMLFACEFQPCVPPVAAEICCITCYVQCGNAELVREGVWRGGARGGGGEGGDVPTSSKKGGGDVQQRH